MQNERSLVSHLRRNLKPYWVFGAFFVYFNILSFIRSCGLTGDEPQYAIDAYNIVFNQSRNMVEIFKDQEVINQFYPSGGLGAHLFGSMLVTFHGVGTSLFCIPAVLFPYPVIALKILFNFYTAVSVTLLFKIAINKGLKTVSKQISLVMIFFAFPPFAFFSDQIYPEIPALLILSIVFYLISIKSKFYIVNISILLSFLPWLHIRFTAITFFAFIYLIFTRQSAWRAKSISLLIFLVSGVLYLVANNRWYDTFNPFFLSSYTYSSFLPYSNLDLVYRFGFGHLFSGTYGLFPWNPLLLVLTVWIIIKSKYREHSLESTIIVLGTISYLITVGMGGSSGGLSFPARYVLILIPIIWISIPFGLFDREKLKNPAMILIILVGVGLSIVGSLRVDSLYGRGESQNTPLMQPYRQLSTLWPDYSLKFGRDPQGVTGTGIQNLSFVEANGKFKADLDFGFVPKGTFFISSNISNQNIREIQIIGDGLTPSQQPLVSHLENGHLISLPYTVRLSGTILVDRQESNGVITLNQVENRASEFPDLSKTLCLIFFISGFTFYVRRRNEFNASENL